MRKRDEVVRFNCLWLVKPIPQAILDMIDNAAHRNGLWVQLFDRPFGKKGALFWLETQNDADAKGRTESFHADVKQDRELREWFESTVREQKS